MTAISNLLDVLCADEGTTHVRSHAQKMLEPVSRISTGRIKSSNAANAFRP